MSSLSPGAVLSLTVTKELPTAYVLTADGSDDVILPKRNTEASLKEGEEVTVFLYEDKQKRLTAATQIPSVTLNAYDWVEVTGISEQSGVFVNIGLEKDILVSKDDLPLHSHVWPARGDQLFVCLAHDKKGRLLAKPVTEEIIEKERDKAPQEMLHKPISGHVYRASKIGSFIITEEGFRAFVHYTERKSEPRLGQWVKGRATEIKADGTINASLRPLLLESRDKDAEQIMQYLIEQGGSMPLTDKATPDAIRETFQMSKAAFKRAMGKLLKEGVVIQKNGRTEFIEKDE